MDVFNTVYEIYPTVDDKHTLGFNPDRSGRPQAYPLQNYFNLMIFIG